MEKIKQQMNDILEMIEEDKIRKKIIDFFMKDVKAYLQKLIKLDQKIKTNGIVSAETNKRYFLFTNEIIEKAEELEKVIGQRLLVQKIKNTFRMFLIDSPAYKSLIVKRAYDKTKKKSLILSGLLIKC